MADENNNNAQNNIESKLRQAFERHRRLIHIRGASCLLIWLIALTILSFIIDWGIFARAGMSGLGIVLPMINVAILLWVLWKDWLKHLQRFNPLLVALEVEERHPELSSLLVSYTELDPTILNQPNISHELLEALRSEAVVRTQPLDFREIVDFKQLKTLLMVCAGVVLISGALSISWRDYLGAFFKRLGGAEVSYPTETEIIEVSQGLVVKAGDDAIIQAKAQKVLPESGLLLVRPLGSEVEWKSLPLVKSSATAVDATQADYSRKLEELVRDIEYRVVLGDDESETQALRVIRSPRVTKTIVKISYPEYMKLDPITQDQLNLEVPESATLNWELRCDSKVASLKVKSDKEVVEAVVDETGKIVRFEMKAPTSFKYSFQWVEGESGKNFKFDDVQHSIKVRKDRIPEVALVRPASDGMATVEKTLRFVAQADDDYGLNEAWVVYSVDGSNEQRVPAHSFKGAKGDKVNLSWKLKDKIKELKPGMTLSFAIEVSDGHPDKINHLRRSMTRQLRIVEPEQYLTWFREELSQQRDEIRRAHESEKDSQDRVIQLKEQEKETP